MSLPRKTIKDHRLRKKFPGNGIRPNESDQYGRFIERAYSMNSKIMAAEVTGPTHTMGKVCDYFSASTSGLKFEPEV